MYHELLDQGIDPDDHDDDECGDDCRLCCGEGKLEDFSCFPDAYGYHPLIKCPRCKGTGKEPTTTTSNT